MNEIVNGTWKKEDELKVLKTEFLALDRKIQLSLKPIEQGEDKATEEVDLENSSKNNVHVRTTASHSYANR